MKIIKGIVITVLGFIGLIFVFAAVQTFTDPEAIEKTNVGVEKNIGTVAKDAKPKKASLTEDQEFTLAQIRQISIQLVSCLYEITSTQDSIDDVVQGKAQPITAYGIAQTGISFCKDATEIFEDRKTANFENEESKSIYESTLPECLAATKAATSALQTAQIAMDGDNSLATAQKYNDFKSEASRKEYACKQGLKGLADRVKLPADVIDFLD